MGEVDYSQWPAQEYMTSSSFSILKTRLEYSSQALSNQSFFMRQSSGGVVSRGVTWIWIFGSAHRFFSPLPVRR